MGYRAYEKTAGRFAAKFGGQRGSYSDLNIDPYGTRTIRPGTRQEEWKDILQHGERSDTDWGKTFSGGAKALRQAYAPRGDWAKRKEMDAVSQHMYDATIGFETQKSKFSIGAQSKEYQQYVQHKAGGLKTITTPGSEGSKDTVSYSSKPKGVDEPGTLYSQGDVDAFEKQTAGISAGMAKASADRKVSAAKWMGAYNEQLNVHERIALSEKRQSYRQRFADMQISKERQQSKKTRDVLKSGATGLQTGLGGAGTGLGI
jgi:hypothetical protein